MLVTREYFLKACPTNTEPEKWVAALNLVLPRYPMIDLRMFLAQTGHESGDYKWVSENLNYSADGLLRVFPRYFTAAQAQNYARQPMLIANRVYSNRMGNGNEASGDGWKFRGGGLLQLTGRANYTAFAQSIGKTIDDTAKYIREPAGAIESACWFFARNILKTDSLETATRKINGGLNGFVDRQNRYRRL